MTSASSQHVPVDGFQRSWAAWHDEQERARTGPGGYLNVTGIHWLGRTPTSVDGVPGLWSADDDGPVVQLEAGSSLVVDDVVRQGRYRFGRLADLSGVTATAGDVVIDIARRGGGYVLRPLDPDHARRSGYTGTPAFLADPRWALSGRFEPFDSARPVQVDTVVPGLEQVHLSPGQVTFLAEGRLHRLTAFSDKLGSDLIVLFHDETNSDSTYAYRKVAVPAPDQVGRVLIDFNRAMNMPCAYIPFFTCPLPPAENRLPFPVLAGEKVPRPLSQ